MRKRKHGINGKEERKIKNEIFKSNNIKSHKVRSLNVCERQNLSDSIGKKRFV